MSTYSEHVKNASLPIDVSSPGDGLVAGVLGQTLTRSTQATLALAKQQQLANLIALGLVYVDEIPETGERGLIFNAPDDVRSCPDIADALGITEQADSKTAGAA